MPGSVGEILLGAFRYGTQLLCGSLGYLGRTGQDVVSGVRLIRLRQARTRSPERAAEYDSQIELLREQKAVRWAHWRTLPDGQRWVIRSVWLLLTVGTVVAWVYLMQPKAGPALAPAGPAASLLLNEVLFLPEVGKPQFIELKNASGEALVLDGYTLLNEKGETFALPAVERVAPGGLLLVVFDGQRVTERSVVHAPRQTFVGQESGAVWLRNKDELADGVAWGAPHPFAIDLCRGGRCGNPSPGSVVARLPDAARPLASSEWAPLDPENATPNQPNLRPPVSAFAGFPGTVFRGKPRFSWYSVPGAARYRIQVGRDQAFRELVDDSTIEGANFDRLHQEYFEGRELPPGGYFWRVQSLGSRGEKAKFSQPIPFSVDPTRRALAQPRSSAQALLTGGLFRARSLVLGAGAAEAAPAPLPARDVRKELDVPVIEHQKDTNMLTLEAENEIAPRSWDAPSTGGYPYCARAGVAMLNAYHGGKLSQDRIGYEAFKDLREGPEYDLPVVGISDARTNQFTLPHAIGTSGELRGNRNRYRGRDVDACDDYIKEQSLQECARRGLAANSQACLQYVYDQYAVVPCPPEIAYAWGFEAIKTIRQEIDAGRPMIATTPNHLFLIVGYAQEGDRFFFMYQDAGGRQDVEADAKGLLQNLDSYWTGLVPVTVRSDEPEIRSDRDGDGVVDFDEIHRFGTNPDQQDSDGDGVNDKQEVRASVWDPEHGYHNSVMKMEVTASDASTEAAAANVSLSGRDADHDGKAMELDPDSDNGGCNDGKEDLNANGKRETNETSNFDRQDDECAVALGGRITMRYGFVPGSPPACKGTLNIRLRFPLAPEYGDVAEENRPSVAPVYNAGEVVYEIATDGCHDIVGGLFDGSDGTNVACNAPGNRKSGTVALGPESYSGIKFFPLSPQIHLLLPESVWLTLPEACVYGDGYTYESEVLHLGSEALDIESGAHCETTKHYKNGMPPSLLDFCVAPSVCNTRAASAADSQTLTDCYTHPERHALIPFSGSLTKRGEVLEWGGVTTVQVDDIHVRWEICKGCGDEFLE